MFHHRPLVAVAAVALIAPALYVTVTSHTSGETPNGSTASPIQATSFTTAVPRGRQKAKLLMHPQIAQPGKAKRPSTKAKSAMTAQFKPRTKGRPVVLQRRGGGRWVTVQRARQDGKGRVEFSARYKNKGQAERYRAVALRHDGLAKKPTKPTDTDHWGRHDFKDEFSSWDTSSWSDRLQGYSKVSLRKCSKADPRARKVKKGTLLLMVKNDPDRGQCRTGSHGRHAYRLNGHVGTQAKETFLYGYAAARIRFQPRAGQHGSFWLQPQNVHDGNGGAEIDVIEWFGNRSNPDRELTSFVHKDGEKIGRYVTDPHRFGRAWANRYHVFSVEWTPNRYVFRIDGKETFRVKRAVSNTPQYLILSLLSSDYELPQMEGRLPQRMRVDWVRYWGSRA